MPQIFIMIYFIFIGLAALLGVYALYLLIKVLLRAVVALDLYIDEKKTGASNKAAETVVRSLQQSRAHQSMSAGLFGLRMYSNISASCSAVLRLRESGGSSCSAKNAASLVSTPPEASPPVISQSKNSL